MKIKKDLILIMAAAGLLASAVPANAQSNRHGGGGNRGNMHHGNFHHGGGGVNFFFGGFGYPFYGYPYYGYPYYGYSDYGYAPYGYGYPAGAYYSYDSQGVYQGRVASGGSGRSLAVQVQQQLAASGYYHGEIDGIIGEGTRRAIRNYERDNNLPVDGRIDDQLLATLGRG
jgi:hypothetical protein